MSYTGLENYGKIINGVQFYNYKAIMQMTDVNKETALAQINSSDPQNEYISYPQLSKIVMDLKMDQLEKMPNQVPKKETQKTTSRTTHNPSIIEKLQDSYHISRDYASSIAALVKARQISSEQLQKMIQRYPSPSVLRYALATGSTKFTDEYGFLRKDFANKMHISPEQISNSLTKLGLKSSSELPGFYTIEQLNMVAKDLLKRPTVIRNKKAAQSLNDWLSNTETTPDQEDSTMLNYNGASEVLADYYQTSQGNAHTIFAIVAPSLPRKKMKLKNDTRPVFYYNKEDLLVLIKQFQTSQELKKEYLNNNHVSTPESNQTVQDAPKPKRSFFQRVFGRK